MKILGMGNALVDVLVMMQNDELLKTLGLPKGSMQLIDESKMQEIKQFTAGLEKHFASGGSVSNAISGMALMGVATGFLGKIGKDEYGKYFRDDLAKNGVAPRLKEVDEASGIATALISPDGERTFGTYLGAAANMTADDLQLSDFEGYTHLYIEGYLVQNYDLIRRAIALAKQAGLKIVWDLASFNVVEANLAFLQEVIPAHVDILFANEEEALAFTGCKGKEAALKIGEWVEIAIVKEGANGSWIKRGDELTHVPALSVKCVDTTGAGDQYSAGFLYGLSKGYDLYRCGEIGSLLAGHIIQEVGARITDAMWANLKGSLQ